MNIFCYQHHINDFRRDTAYLTCEQRGVYRDLIDAYYFNAGNLTADIEQLIRIVGVHTESERSALAHAVATFFTIENGKLSQKRANEEIEKIKNKSIKAIASAKSKHQKYNRKDASVRCANGHANALLTKNQEPRTKKLAGREKFCEEEILPSEWQDVAERKGIPNEKIFMSWRKFKDTTAFPYQFKRWQAWVEREIF